MTVALFSLSSTVTSLYRTSWHSFLIETFTMPAANSALLCSTCSGVAFFNTSRPALQSPPTAPKLAAMDNPTMPVPGTVTPIPFFIKLGETSALMRVIACCK